MWSHLPDIALHIAHDRRAHELVHISHGRPLHAPRHDEIRPRQQHRQRHG